MIRRTLMSALATAGALALFAAPSHSSEWLLHLALDRSEPEADAVVEAPEELRLWFTQEPQQGSTSIRLLDAAGELVATTRAAQSADDPLLFTVTVESPPLPPAQYTVTWRAMAVDGHVVNEDFQFSVRASDP